MYYIGIDPGVSGAITILNNDGSYLETIKTPMLELDTGAYKQWYDTKSIINLFNEYKDSYVCLEYQRPIINRYGKKSSAGGQGAVSIFRTGRGFGLLEGLTSVIFNKHVEIVDPNRWQNFLINKYLNEDEIQALKLKTLNYDYIISLINDKKFHKWYSKFVTLKSYTKAKKKTAYLFYKILESEDFNINLSWKDHNKVDSFLIAKYGFHNFINT